MIPTLWETMYLHSGVLRLRQKLWPFTEAAKVQQVEESEYLLMQQVQHTVVYDFIRW